MTAANRLGEGEERPLLPQGLSEPHELAFMCRRRIQDDLPPVLIGKGQSQGEGIADSWLCPQEGTAGGDDETSASAPTLRRLRSSPVKSVPSFHHPLNSTRRVGSRKWTRASVMSAERPVSPCPASLANSPAPSVAPSPMPVRSTASSTAGASSHALCALRLAVQADPGSAGANLRAHRLDRLKRGTSSTRSGVVPPTSAAEATSTSPPNQGVLRWQRDARSLSRS